MATMAVRGTIARFGRSMRRLASSLVALLLLLALAIVAGALPLGSRPEQRDDRSVTIHVASNGFHSDIVLPMVSGSKDWRPLLSRSPLTEPHRDAPWVAFGWGAETAYTELGTLADLSPGLILKAAAFDRSVVHVQPVTAVRTGSNLRSFTVSHGTGDAFLRGRDRFWLLRSCNVWTGEGLRKAGLPLGLWTPLVQSLMWSLGPGDAPER